MCATEIKLITMLMEEVGISYPKPAMLLEGAIFILNNDQVGQRTKHIDIKWHHVRDMIKDGDLVVMYVRSEDNLADIMMKNTNEALLHQARDGYEERSTSARSAEQGGCRGSGSMVRRGTSVRRSTMVGRSE